MTKRSASIGHAVLGLLTSGQRHGYELRRQLEVEFGPAWRIDFGQLYRVLAALHRKGWVNSTTCTSPRGPNRKMYALTARGRAALQRWLADPTAHERGRDELPLKLRFGLADRRGAPQHALAERRRILHSRKEHEQERCAQTRRARDAARWALAEQRRQAAEAALAGLDTCTAVIPARRTAARSSVDATLVVCGSDDPVLGRLASQLTSSSPSPIRFSPHPVGSLAGLIALSDGRAQIAGIHLLDVESGEYNVPFVKRLLPEESLVLVNLARRDQGLLVASGNPKRIRGVGDLARARIRVVNRQRGAGTRLLLYHRLRAAGIDPHDIVGYERELPTHDAVAAAIVAGAADVGPGIRAVAEMWGLDFLPLGQERYDLAVPRQLFESAALRPLLDVLHDATFRAAAAALPGYDVTDMGAVVASIH